LITPKWLLVVPFFAQISEERVLINASHFGFGLQQAQINALRPFGQQ
jgi:hypothetical protein